MPGWSTEIANEFIRLAAKDGHAFDQMQLQELVYIAHGWCLAATGQPLTGDRPEALAHGPEYRRLAEALAKHGTEPIAEEISDAALYDSASVPRVKKSDTSELDHSDRDWVARIYKEYGELEGSKLAAVTRHENTPWAQVFADGQGASRYISHAMIRAQFVELSSRSTYRRRRR